MRPFVLQTCNRSLRTLTKPALSQLSRARMSTGIPNADSLKIEARDIQTAPGVSLSSDQQTIVGSVLDLFAGRPSPEKLKLWADEGTFEDPITKAEGRTQYEAQWTGLEKAMSKIERLGYSVKDAGNPILMDLKTKYTIKGVNTEKTVDSLVEIYLDQQGKIERVNDKWDGKPLPTGAVAETGRKMNAKTVPWFAGGQNTSK